MKINVTPWDGMGISRCLTQKDVLRSWAVGTLWYVCDNIFICCNIVVTFIVTTGKMLPPIAPFQFFGYLNCFRLNSQNYFLDTQVSQAPTHVQYKLYIMSNISYISCPLYVIYHLSKVFHRYNHSQESHQSNQCSVTLITSWASCAAKYGQKS